MALTNTAMWSGNNGGFWNIYLQNKDKKYYLLSCFFIRPEVMAILPYQHGIARIVTYSRGGGNKGAVIEYFLSGMGVEEGRIMHVTWQTDEDDAAQAEPEEEPMDPRDARDLLYFLQVTNESEYQQEFCRLSDYLRDKNCRWQDSW